jgi:hypothetical protein
MARTVRSDGDRPSILVSGRKRAIARAVRPDRVQQMMASTSMSIAACHAAWVMACVMRSGPSGKAFRCSRPRRLAHCA